MPSSFNQKITRHPQWSKGVDELENGHQAGLGVHQQAGWSTTD
jgi:hypothetical protein